jgi:hypothetical protein
LFLKPENEPQSGREKAISAASKKKTAKEIYGKIIFQLSISLLVLCDGGKTKKILILFASQ